MPSGFIPDPKFNAELAADVEFQEQLEEQAARGAEQVGEFVHRIMPAKGHPHQVEARRFPAPEGVKIINFDHGGHFDEWGTVNNPPYAPMRRGLNSAGFRLAENE